MTRESSTGSGPPNESVVGNTGQKTIVHWSVTRLGLRQIQILLILGLVQGEPAGKRLYLVGKMLPTCHANSARLAAATDQSTKCFLRSKLSSEVNLYGIVTGFPRYLGAIQGGPVLENYGYGSGLATWCPTAASLHGDWSIG